ncbi:MAG: hypothetical protein IIU08_03935 [Clostridia bacterium]|nr:hypothetical protein [Clostridia bacterium]MBQ3955548.1 hypothetical protein [Clostridia bacterium]MBQ5355001.1 hypothetical protein [Clostridia bacterium]
MSAENRHETPEERKARIEREAEAFAKEGLNVVPGTKPFTRYKVAELILCLLAVILGLLYLYTDPKIVPLDVLMPAYAAIFWIIIPLRLKDAKVLGTKGAARFLSVVVWVILALAVTAATAVYFIWY